MTDIAKLGVEVAPKGVKETKSDLDALATSGGGAERSMKKVTLASHALSGEISAVVMALRANTAATEQNTLATSALAASKNNVANAASNAANALKGEAAASNSSAAAASKAASINNNIANQKRKVKDASDTVTKSLALQKHEWLNLGYQLQDVGVSLASGQNPLLVMAQQGSQVFQVLAGSRGGIKGALGEVMGLVGRTAMRFAPLGIAIGVVSAGFALFTRNVKKGNEDLTKGMGLSEDQLERVKNKSVTMGDSIKGFFSVVGSRLYSAFKGPIDALRKGITDALDGITHGTGTAIGFIVGSFVGAFRAIGATWKMLPAVLGDAMISAANIALREGTKLVNGVIGLVNGAIDGINQIRKANGAAEIGKLGELTALQFANPFEGAMKEAGTAGTKAFAEGMAEGQDWVKDFASDWAKETLEAAKARIKKEAGKGPKPTKGGKSDAEKEYENAVKAAKEYIDSLKAEARQLGLNEFQRKELEGKLQVEKLLKAGITKQTLELASAIEKETKALVEKMKAQDLADETKRLTAESALLAKEASLINASNREREVTIAQFQKLAELTAKGHDPNSTATQAVAKKAGDNAGAAYDNSLGLGSAISQQQTYLDGLKEMQAATEQAASGMANAFGSVGGALGQLTVLFGTMAVEREESALRIAEAEKKYKDVPKGDLEITRIRKAESAKLARAELKNYGDMAGAAKGFFKEKSTGYKIMQTAEMAFRTFEFIMSAKSIAVKAVETGAKIGLYGAETAAGVTAGAANIFAMLGPFGFPVVASMLAVMAGLGFGGGSGGAASSAVAKSAGRQDSQGTGTVLGDPTAKSASISKSMEIAASNSNKELEYSNGMLNALRSIDSNIVTLTSAIARQIGVSGGMFDTSGLKLGTSGKTGFFGGKTVNRELSDLGLKFNAQSVADILSNGVSGNSFQELMTTTTKKGFLGIGGSTKTAYSTETGEIGADIKASIVAVIGSLQAGIASAAKALGVTGAEEALRSFVVNLGTISFEGMNGSEIQDALNGVFSKVGDEMANSVIPGIASLQKAGEGSMETLVRLAREYQVVDVAMASLGKTFNSVGLASVAARDYLVNLFESLDEFTELTASFGENFLTDAERLAPVAASVTKEMGRLGLSGITTKEAFKTLVLGIDTTTTAGAEMYAALLKIAPAFAKVTDAAQEAIDLRVTNAKKTMEDARDTLFTVYTKEANALVTLKNKWIGFADTLRKTIQELTTGTLAYLSPENQYNAAKALFQDTAGRAQRGDETAISDLPAVAKAFAEASRDYNASSKPYYDDLASIKQALASVAGMADGQATAAQDQLNALNNLMDGIDGVLDGVVRIGDATYSLNEGIYTVNSSVLTVAGAISGLQSAIGEYKAAADAQTAAANAAAASALAAAQTALDALKNQPATPTTTTPTVDTPTATQPAVWTAAGYLANNPDIVAGANDLLSRADPNSPWYAEHGLDRGAEGFAEWHYNQGGGNLENRKFATGGSFKVGGSGGPDSQYMPLWLTPGEVVDVKRPNQVESGEGDAKLAGMIAALITQTGAVGSGQIEAITKLAEQMEVLNRRIMAR